MAVSLAAISISAALVEMWFRGDLLGIALFLTLWTLVFFWVLLAVLVFCSVLGELMGFNSLLPLMYVFPSGAVTTYELPSFLFRMTCTGVSRLPVMWCCIHTLSLIHI